ncbi:hypothetical protein [Phenylobacterium sp. J367]|uniref:hypothetical protein n=1 Tax=Phenylobacterium sp. J367 TaxID=2898435 RepID=UPI0021517142|nr:hypothetical protein [Phenylobacterium sp. J367]MCR5879068.1 hypothetical protein [Phenylobacterium sp. J367]
MRRRAALSFTVACVLSACAHQQTPSALPGMAWSLHSVEGEGAKLAFGQPYSDNVVLMLSCQPGSGTVLVSANAPADARPELTLASGTRSARYRADVAPGLGEGALVEASAAAADPVLKRFADSGELSVAVNGRSTAMPGDRAKARQFVASCAG